MLPNKIKKKKLKETIQRFLTWHSLSHKECGLWCFCLNYILKELVAKTIIMTIDQVTIIMTIVIWITKKNSEINLNQ